MAVQGEADPASGVDGFFGSLGWVERVQARPTVVDTCIARRRRMARVRLQHHHPVLSSATIPSGAIFSTSLLYRARLLVPRPRCGRDSVGMELHPG